MNDEMKKLISKSKLTEEELKIFFEARSKIDHKLDHSRAYRTMMNETRRELLRFIGYDVRSIDEIKKEFKQEDDHINYHLSMLEQCLYVIESNKGWKSTPRGLGFLENARLED